MNILFIYLEHSDNKKTPPSAWSVSDVGTLLNTQRITDELLSTESTETKNEVNLGPDLSRRILMFSEI